MKPICLYYKVNKFDIHVVEHVLPTGSYLSIGICYLHSMIALHPIYKNGNYYVVLCGYVDKIPYLSQVEYILTCPMSDLALHLNDPQDLDKLVYWRYSLPESF